MTHAWLEAGYTTAEVDMAARTLVFRKAAHYGPAAKAESGELREAVATPAPAAAEADSFSLVFGALKGTVTIKPGDRPDRAGRGGLGRCTVADDAHLPA